MDIPSSRWALTRGTGRCSSCVVGNQGLADQQRVHGDEYSDERGFGLLIAVWQVMTSQESRDDEATPQWWASVNGVQWEDCGVDLVWGGVGGCMRVFIAGATGVLGRRLVSECSRRGHDVVGLTRDAAGDALVEERGGEPHRGDLFESSSLVEGVAEADVVVHAATKIPTSTNPDSEAWAENDRVRREGTRNLVAAAGGADVERFIQQSVVWLARQPDGEPFDETADPHPDRSTESALDAEEIVQTAAADHGFEPVILRGGYFYAHDAAHTELIGEELLEGFLPIIGRGLLGRQDARLSFLHVDDAARAFADAVEGDATGLFHVVDDAPKTYAAFIEAFTDRLGASTPRRLPAWLARLFVDANTVRLLTRPMPTTNERFKETFGWIPEYPTIESGIDAVIDTWEATGVIESTPDGYSWHGP